MKMLVTFFLFLNLSGFTQEMSMKNMILKILSNELLLSDTTTTQTNGNDSLIIIKTGHYSKGNYYPKAWFHIYYYPMSKLKDYHFFILNENKEIVRNYQINNNKKEGMQIVINDSLLERSFYRNNQRHGVEILTNLNTNCKVKISTYIEGKLDGQVCYYYSNGVIKKIIEYKKGIPEGLFTTFNSKGETIVLGEVSGEYYCVLNRVSFEDVWYLNGVEVSIDEIPSYIPKTPSLGMIYNVKYPKRVGMWVYYDSLGNVTNSIVY